MQSSKGFGQHAQLEEQYWRQKSNVKWIKEGVLNAKLFHHLEAHRRKQLFIHQIKDGQGQMLTDQKEIWNAAMSYFKDQLFGNHVSQGVSLLTHSPRMVTEDDNKLLDCFPSI